MKLVHQYERLILRIHGDNTLLPNAYSELDRLRELISRIDIESDVDLDTSLKDFRTARLSNAGI